jgi:hypothetical protein
MSQQTGGVVHPAAIKEYEANRNGLTPSARTALVTAIQATGLEIESRSGTLERLLERTKEVVFYGVLTALAASILWWFFRH